MLRKASVPQGWSANLCVAQHAGRCRHAAALLSCKLPSLLDNVGALVVILEYFVVVYACRDDAGGEPGVSGAAALSASHGYTLHVLHAHCNLQFQGWQTPPICYLSRPCMQSSTHAFDHEVKVQVQLLAVWLAELDPKQAQSTAAPCSRLVAPAPPPPPPPPPPSRACSPPIHQQQAEMLRALTLTVILLEHNFLMSLDCSTVVVAENSRYLPSTTPLAHDLLMSDVSSVELKEKVSELAPSRLPLIA